MTISRKLKEYLDDQEVHYEVLIHEEAYTSPEIAHTLHVPGKDLAKVIIVTVEDRFVMTVLPSTWKVDLNRLKEVFQANHVRLATEEEFKGLFPDCDLGAMPPFGNLYGLDVYVDRSRYCQLKPDLADWMCGAHSVIPDTSMDYLEANGVLGVEFSLS